MVYRQFKDIPNSLMEYMSKQSTRLIITHEVRAGQYSRVTKIAKINPMHIIRQDGVFQEELVHLLDHILGGRPNRPDVTLSAGYGINEKVKRLGKEINSLYRRGESYYFYAYMETNEREYLAQAVRQYLQDDPEIIAELDILLYNMIKDRFLNDDFWSEVI